MKLLFIDDRPCSCQNGIGTFRDVFISALSTYPGVDITIISLDSATDEKLKVVHDNCNEIQLPPYNGGNWRCSGDLIASELENDLADSCENIFIMNYSPCAEFIAQIKKVYPLSKWVFVIHDQGWCAPLLGDRRLLSSILRGKVPAIVSDETAQFVREYCAKEIDIYNIVDRIVCLSDSMHGILTHIYKIPTQKIIRIENGLSGNHRVFKRFSRNSARKELGLPKSSEVIIYVGRPVRNKGFDALIIAIKELRKRRPDLRCVIAGDVNKVIGRWDLCKECAANIILPGFLTRSELGKWYAAADIGVMPSYSEQCSFASLEMMEAGLPVVSSDGIGHRDMFHKDTNAFVVSIGNVVKVRKYAKRLSVKIDEALSSSALLRRRFAAYNRKLMTIKYSASVMAEKYIEMFHDILSDSSH